MLARDPPGPPDPPASTCLPRPLGPPDGAMARLSIKIPTPTAFSGEGEDLKPEAFDRWYKSTRNYLLLHGVNSATEGSGNYYGLYTTGRAQEAYFQAIERYGEELTRDELIEHLPGQFQFSKNTDDLYKKFDAIEQVIGGSTNRITTVAIDMLMY